MLRLSVGRDAIGVVDAPDYRAGGGEDLLRSTRVCQKFCARSEGGSPACMSVCSGYLQTCLESGCWESKYVDKECGFTRQ